MLKISEIYKDIYHVDGDDQVELASTFLRFQEHYESPKFRDKIFTLEEFDKWYKGGVEAYVNYWQGFNIPSSVLFEFYCGKFKNITHNERMLLNYFGRTFGKFYIIGTYRKEGEKESEELRHELCHALYTVDEDYRKAVDRILNTASFKWLERWLTKVGYHKCVHLDETHAYMSSDYYDLLGNRAIWSFRKYDPIYKTIHFALSSLADVYLKQRELK